MTVAAEQILSWVENKAPESAVLEFKRVFWSDRVEMAKDVAALANHRGGSIIVGVAEKDGRAHAIVDAQLPSGADQVVHQALVGHLVPAGVAGSVDVYGVTVEHNGGHREVLVLDVEPWAHGPVAVRAEDRSLRLHVRRDARCVDLGWEEAMDRLDAARRRHWIRLTKWFSDHPDLGVELHSEIRLLELDARWVVLPPGLSFGRVAYVADDQIAVDMHRVRYLQSLVTHVRVQSTPTFRQDDLGMALALWAATTHAESTRDTSEHVRVSLPFDLVNALWFGGSSGDEARVHASLAGPLVWTGSAMAIVGR